MSKKSKKELAKAEAMMNKALKMQAKARKMQEEAVRMQLAMIRPGGAALMHPENTGSVNIQPGPATPPGTGAALNTATISPGAQADAGTYPDDASTATSLMRRHVRRNRAIYAAIGAVIILAGIYLGFAASRRGESPVEATAAATAEPAEAPAPAPAASGGQPTTVSVVDKWEMPGELLEISSNAFLDTDRIACIQDNDGIIYTYNLKTRQVENRLRFGPQGDYEALSVVGNLFYVLRSDGHLFEVQPAAAGKPAVRQYDLPLNAEQDTEPMFYDAPNNRLLVGVKEKDPQSSGYKGVYSFDLATKTMAHKPVMTIPAAHDGAADDGSKKKKKKKTGDIKPSEIAIDPRSGNLYVLNGPQSEFLIIDRQGALQQTIQLDRSIFPQPEGMCFSPDGALYISSEGGKKGTGIIAKVELK